MQVEERVTLDESILVGEPKCVAVHTEMHPACTVIATGWFACECERVGNLVCSALVQWVATSLRLRVHQCSACKRPVYQCWSIRAL